MRILHAFRSPLGGLFRHVMDLSLEQTKLGYDVGIVCASEAASPGSEATLAELATSLKLGVHRIPMARLPHPSDLRTLKQFKSLVAESRAHIVHGHGAKGGMHARFCDRPSFYTPHGGSLHYKWASPQGFAFLSAERALARRTSGFVFVCEFERNAFSAKIGLANKPSCVVHNGLRPDEFEAVMPNKDADDIIFVGEMRGLKGVDLLIEAIAKLRTKRRVTATLVGDGAEQRRFETLAAELGLKQQITFAGRLPIREALKRGKLFVLPSRNESFPYVVLEAAAAGRRVIASAVGGIPEVLPASQLFEPDSVSALATRIEEELNLTEKSGVRIATRLSDSLRIDVMAQKITDFYSSTSGPIQK